MQTASFYIRLPDNKTECLLCPHNCIIQDGEKGICKVRFNKEGVLFTQAYDNPIALNTDPIEKKPLYHFFPGQQILSIGTFGCNLKCSFCQNFEISQNNIDGKEINGGKKEIKDIIQLAKEKQKNIGLAYTYNEPVVYYEYMTKLALEVHDAGLKNVMVSNGFINPEPLSELLKLIDAFNIDLKSFSNEFYKKYTLSKLEPVLNTIKTIFKSGKYIELTYLVIPGLNDDPEEFDAMTEWIVKETSKETVLHISRYFPSYKMDIPPTPIKTLENLYHHAIKRLDYVYVGNIHDNNLQNTYCPVCKSLVLKRNGYFTSNEGLDAKGFCMKCQLKIIKYMTNNNGEYN